MKIITSIFFLASSAGAVDLRPSTYGQALYPSSITATGSISVPGSILTSTTTILKGPVGINTASPSSSYSLETSGDIYLNRSSAGGDAKMAIRAGDNRNATISLQADREDQAADRWVIVSSAADNSMRINNGGTANDLIAINSSGDFGIATTSPATTLDVNGNAIIRGYETLTGSMTVQGNEFSVGSTTVAVKNGNLGIGYADPLHRLHIVETTQTPGALLKIPLMINYNGQATNATDVTAGIYSFATENGAVTGTTGHRVGVLGRSSDTINSAMPLIGVESRTDAYGSASTYDGGLAYVLGTYPGAVPASIFTGLRVRSQITSDGSTPNAGGTMAGILIEDMVGGGPSTHWSIYQAGADDPSYLAGRLGIGTSSPRGSLDVDGIIYSTEAYVSGKITASSIVLGGGRVARTLYSWYGSSATSASADLQILGTYTLPANTLAANGDSVYVVCWSSTVATSETKQLSPFVDTTNLNAGQSTTATGLKTDATIGRRGASSQWAQSTRVNSGITNVITALTLDETAAHTITCQGAEASAVASGMVLTGMTVEYRPAP